VVGDIVTQRISIDEGVTFKGSVNVQKELPKNDLVGMTPLLSTKSK
jgi:cytoskeletal protein CcmA (bactofilin family)